MEDASAPPAIGVEHCRHDTEAAAAHRVTSKSRSRLALEAWLTEVEALIARHGQSENFLTGGA